MTLRKLDVDHLPLLQKLEAVLHAEPDPVRQQMAIELMLVSHAIKAGNKIEACYIIDAVAKHAKQMVTGHISMLVDGERRT